MLKVENQSGSLGGEAGTAATSVSDKSAEKASGTRSGRCNVASGVGTSMGRASGTSRNSPGAYSVAADNAASLKGWESSGLPGGGLPQSSIAAGSPNSDATP
jgi:hypothetical protein